MSKGKETKKHIIREAANLFNTQGYAASSISDIMQATGLKKGGIYRHFESKQALSVAAFDFAYERVYDAYEAALKQSRHAVDRLLAVAAVSLLHLSQPLLPGGCPLLNLAIESDDGDPILRERAQSAMHEWQALIVRIVNKGVERGELVESVDGAEVASLLISLMEGSVMMTRLVDDPVHLQRAYKHFEWYVQQALSS